MKNPRLVLSVAVAMFLVLSAGCVPPVSVNPLYTDKDIVNDPEIVGLWSKGNLDEAWRFTKSDGDYYNLKILSKDGTSSYVIYLLKIKDVLYMDAYPDLKSVGPNPNMLVFPAHAFLRVNKTDSGLELTALDAEWFSKYMKENPDALPYQVIFDEKHLNPEEFDPVIMITASTEKLQNFIAIIQGKDEAFAKGLKVKLQRSK